MTLGRETDQSSYHGTEDEESEEESDDDEFPGTDRQTDRHIHTYMMSHKHHLCVFIYLGGGKRRRKGAKPSPSDLPPLLAKVNDILQVMLFTVMWRSCDPHTQYYNIVEMVMWRSCDPHTQYYNDRVTRLRSFRLGRG